MSDRPRSLVSDVQSDADLIASLLLRFDRKWSPGQIEKFALELRDWPEESRRQALLVLVKADMEHVWQSGQTAEVEQYLARLPELGTTQTVAPELLIAEWEVRTGRGEQPRFGDFARRFPRQADALRQLIRQAAGASMSRNKPDAPPELNLAAAETSRVMSGHADSLIESGPRNVAANAARNSTPSQAVTDLPTNFGRYRIVKKLGEGGMGAVYLAEDTQLDRRVALKVPFFDARTGSEVLERFEREARTAASLSHSNICQIHDVGQFEGRHFLTMEYIDGHPLSHWIGRHKLTDRQVVMLIRRVANAVSEAHQKGIIHRDLKPANVMITAKGEPKVMDFGLAKRTNVDEARLTSSGTIVGTPAYMPTEQMRGELDQIGPHSDVYSLGVILYELLTGRLPFEVPSDAPITALFAKILTAPVDPPSKHRPDLDPRLEAIVLKAIAKQSAERYASMAELSAALGENLKSPARSSNKEADPNGCSTDVVGSETSGAGAHRNGDNAPLISFDGDFVPALGTQRRVNSHWKTFILAPINNLRSRWHRLPISSQVFSMCAGIAVLAAVTLWLRIGDAVIKVEVLAADVIVSFQNDRITLKDGPRELHAKPGAHTLHITSTSGDLDFDTDKFTLKRGDNPTVTVELVKSEIVARMGDLEIARHSLVRSIQSSSSSKSQDVNPAISERAVAFTNSLGMSFVLIDPLAERDSGRFMMGSPLSEPGRDAMPRDFHRYSPDKGARFPLPQGDQELRHPVRLTRPFYLCVTEVTEAQYETVMEKKPAGSLGSEYPIRVHGSDAEEFVRRLGSLPSEQAAGRVYRLPTEAEWEYTCRAGADTAYSFGDDPSRLFDYAWFAGNSNGQPHTVATKSANRWGLYDMHGNVAEWCQDVYELYPQDEQVDPLVGGTPLDKETTPRVVRGGSSRSPADQCRSAWRFRNGTRTTYLEGFGIRVAMTHRTTAADDLERQPPAPATAQNPDRPFEGKTAGEVRDDNSLKMKLVWCPPGEFKMGDPELELRVNVTLSQGFWLGQTEVTQDQWQAIMWSNPWKGWSQVQEGADFPATHISHGDAGDGDLELDSAALFCQRLTEQERLTGRLPAGWKYALPNEAQWEYACRAGSTMKYSFGDDASRFGDYEWFYNNTEAIDEKYAHRVGLKRANAWGLFDMHGNVSEWCADRYEEELPGGQKPPGVSAPFSRMCRGGCWRFPAYQCYPAQRSAYAPNVRRVELGLRVAAVPAE